jgi:hypothetical protein
VSLEDAKKAGLPDTWKSWATGFMPVERWVEFPLQVELSMRTPVPLRRAYKLINHGPTTLITSAAAERRNVMAAAWVMGLDFEPARLAAVIASGTHTRVLVEETGEFVVNVPTLSMIDTVYAVGKVSGADEDKFEQHGLVTAPASVVSAPASGRMRGLARVPRHPGGRDRGEVRPLRRRRGRGVGRRRVVRGRAVAVPRRRPPYPPSPFGPASS